VSKRIEESIDSIFESIQPITPPEEEKQPTSLLSLHPFFFCMNVYVKWVDDVLKNNSSVKDNLGK